MDIFKTIKYFLGRDFSNNEVVIVNHGDGNGDTIYYWNIPDISQPTIGELEALQPQIEAEEQNSLIKKQIADIEQKQDRALRDFAIGIDGAQARLLNIENEIQALRIKLT